jgi:hypothetical protein
MTEEQRVHERYPAFEIVDLVARDSAGNEHIYPIMLRDKSPTGLGGVYIGQDSLDLEAEYSLKRQDGAEKKARIIWRKKVADYVSLLALEIVED